MPFQHLDQVLPLSVANSLLHTIAETIFSVWTKQNWGKTDPRAALLLWDTNTTHHEFLSKMLRNRVNMLMKQEKICLCHSYPVPRCLKYAKRYFCLSLNKCVCVLVCACGGAHSHLCLSYYNSTVSNIQTALCVAALLIEFVSSNWVSGPTCCRQAVDSDSLHAVSACMMSHSRHFFSFSCCIRYSIVKILQNTPYPPRLRPCSFTFFPPN